jgi:hypothetical protein
LSKINLITLNKPNGDTVVIPPVAMAATRLPEAGEYTDGSQSVLITTNGHKHGVTETLAEIDALIAALPGT